MKKLREDIRNRTFEKVYLLYGKESYLRLQYRQKLLQALVAGEDDMNFTRFSGKDTEERAVIAQAETMPLFSDRRVILVEDSGMFRNKAEELADYLEKLPDYLVLIFSEEEADKRTRMFKAVRQYGYAAEFAEQNEATLIRWILSRIGREGKKITEPNMRLFLSMTGTDMSNIANELEKLLSYCGERAVIGREDIEAVCVPQITDRVFEMIRAVTEHDRGKALDLYYDLLALKVKPLRILYLMTRQYDQLFRIGSMARDGLPQAEMAARAGMPPFAVKRSLGLLRRYSDAQLREILEQLVQAEQEVKTGRLDEGLSVEMAIVRLSARRQS